MARIAVRAVTCILEVRPTLLVVAGDPRHKAGEIGTWPVTKPCAATLCRGFSQFAAGFRLRRAREFLEPLHQEIDEDAHLGRQIAAVWIDGKDAAAGRDAVVEHGH